MPNQGQGGQGIPHQQLQELREINQKCGKIIAILKGNPLPDDPAPTLLQQTLAAINQTNVLLQQIVDNQSEPQAASLGLSGGTIVPK